MDTCLDHHIITFKRKHELIMNNTIGCWHLLLTLSDFFDLCINYSTTDELQVVQNTRAFAAALSFANYPFSIIIHSTLIYLLLRFRLLNVFFNVFFAQKFIGLYYIFSTRWLWLCQCQFSYKIYFLIQNIIISLCLII